MGIKGTVRRSTDGDFIHANVDIDLIIEEEMEYGSDEKPVEMFHMIEHFCLGRRRLHIFGSDSSIRPGWLTVGPNLTSSNFDAELYKSHFNKEPNGFLSGCTDEIERLRPKSPPPKNRDGGDRGRGRGRGRGDGTGQPRGGASRGGRGMSSRGGMQERGGASSRGGRGGDRGSWRGGARGGYRGRGGNRGREGGMSSR